MIRINLLPQEGSARPERAAGAGGGTFLVALILIIAYAAVFAIGAGLFYLKAQDEKKTAVVLAEQQKVKAELDDLKETYETLREYENALENQIAVLKGLDPEDRLFWAKKLNILPVLTPDGVYLERIEVTERVTETETPESQAAYAKWRASKNRKASEAPPKIMRTIITQTLQLHGIAYSPDGSDTARLGLVNEFYRNLSGKTVTVPFSREQVTFMEHFVPDIGTSQISEVGMQGRQVTRFSFTFRTKPITAGEGPQT